MTNTISLDVKRIFLAGFMAVAVLLVVLLMRPGGIGGTGIGGGEGSGGGLGGTGVGTGFIGRIDSFGSIWVNGTEIFYDDDIPVSFGGRVGIVSELAIGHVVQVVAKPNDLGVYRASSLVVRYEIVGQVQSQDLNSVTISDQRVLLSGAISPPNLGGTIAVSGFRRSDGMIIASHIDMVDAGKPVVAATLEKPFKEDVENLSLSGYMRSNADGYSLYGYRVDTVPSDFVPERLTTVTAKTNAGGLTIINMRQQSNLAMPTPEAPEPDAPKTGPVPKPVPINAPQVEPPQKRLVVPKPQPAPRNKPETTRPERAQALPQRQEMQDMEAPERGQDTMMNEPPAEPQRGMGSEAEEGQQREEPETQTETQTETQDERSEEGSALPAMDPEANPDTPDMNPERGGDMPHDERTAPERDTRPDMQPPAQRPDRAERMQPPQRVDRPDRPERMERPERPMRPERPDRPERPERPERPR